ncbi:MAG: MBOAT family O-acyltransferase, partial [Myxococcota bacterium]
MLFNSLTYFFFLILAVVIYWSLPHRFRTRFLLACSLLFYCAWDWRYGGLLVGAVVVNFVGARYVARLRRRWVTACVVATNLLVLVYFKYLGFFAETANSLLSLWGGTRSIPAIDILLPLGISFFIFQCMSYVLDVSRGDEEPEGNFERFALYVMFWPQLVAGPIMRAHELTHQFARRLTLHYSDFAVGARRIIEGLFLKVVIADHIASFIDEGFAKATYASNSALDNWTLAFGFGFQIYFDFAGYSSIAIGSARLLGIRLTENFNYPYVAISPREFWQRWHITLSSWIRDYLYIPMQGLVAHGSRSGGGIDVAESVEAARRHNTAVRNLALILTWILMGLWHGANWTFV